jgi:hypothetical protein
MRISSIGLNQSLDYQAKRAHGRIEFKNPDRLGFIYMVHMNYCDNSVDKLRYLYISLAIDM